MVLLFGFTLLLGGRCWGPSLLILLGPGCVSSSREMSLCPGWSEVGAWLVLDPAGPEEQELTTRSLAACDSPRCSSQPGLTHRSFQNLLASFHSLTLSLASAVTGHPEEVEDPYSFRIDAPGLVRLWCRAELPVPILLTGSDWALCLSDPHLCALG